jgi:predicted DNA-binding mobile mystery protein A
MKPLDHLAISQANRRIKTIRQAFQGEKVHPGWIHYMRQTLNMTLKKLAERVGVSIATVAQAERGEAAGKVTIGTLKAMAQAMECEFVYAFISKVDIDELLKKKALEKAKQILSRADTHMTLENQRVEQNFQDRLEMLANKLFDKGDVW